MHRLIITGIILTFLFSFTGCITDDDGGTGGGSPDIVAKFIGKWQVTDSKAKLNYEVKIERDVLYDTKIILKNFAGVGSQISGSVVGNAVVIEQQTTNGYDIEGTGSYANNKLLNFTFLLSDGIDEEMRKAEFVR
jgi:hypothetical protein